MRKFSMVCILFFFLVTLTSCSSNKVPKKDVSQETKIKRAEVYIPEIGTPGGELVSSLSSDPKTFNPILAQETSSIDATNFIFEGLLTFDPTIMDVEPLLAARWDTSEDGLTWTFYLRNDVKWHDGEDFTADDVVFTYNDLIYNDDIPTMLRDVFTIDGKKFEVSKVDDYTVQFKLPVKFAPFLNEMVQVILPEHKYKESVENGTFQTVLNLDTDVANIVGTGPFMLTEYVPGQKLSYTKNTLYWKKDKEGNQLPYIDNIVYLIVDNEDTALLKFQNNEIDFYALRGTDYPLLKPTEKDGNYTVFELGSTFVSNFLVFNQNPLERDGVPVVDPIKRVWFENVDFRKAISYALDRNSMIDIVLNSLGTPQWGPLTETVGYFYNDDLIAYDLNIKKSNELLDSMGFIDTDNDGVREDAEGNPLEFSLITNSDNSIRVKIAEMIRKDLENIGIKVYFSSLDFNTLVSKLTENYEWEAIFIGLTSGIEPHAGKNVWHSSAMLHMWNPLQESPATDWEKRVDEIFTQGAQELNKEERKKFYDEWQRIANDKLPMIYTVAPDKIVAVRNKYSNMYPTNFGGVLWNIEELYLK